MADELIETICPGCNRRFEVPLDEQGRIAECPHCQGWVDVPELDPPPASGPIISEGLPIVVDELTLRRVTYDDCADLFEIYSNQDIVRYELFPPWTFKETERYVRSQLKIHTADPGVPIVLVAEHRSEGKVIGDCSLTINSVEDRQGDISFSLNSKLTDREFATKMLNAALGFGFSSLALHRIATSIDVRDERAWHLMERIGMRREGHMTHATFVDGEWVDYYLYAILEDEWRAKNR
jgi:RimJ/RimL family protein N-acetyltransferase